MLYKLLACCPCLGGESGGVQRKDSGIPTNSCAQSPTLVALESQVKKGVLSIQEITDKVNEGLEDRVKHPASMIGRVLSSLGVQKRRITGGPMGIIFNPEEVCRLAGEYGTPYPSLPEIPKQTSLL